MDDDDDDKVIGLDLNRQPFLDPSPPPQPPPPPAPPSPGLASFSDELETSQSGIEDRIRQLEAVTARANQRHRWRRFMNDPELNYMPVIESTNANCKRDISNLAKALEVDLDSKNIDKGGVGGSDGNFYDCNICLDMAKDPILTCCGHLFCWACFYQVPYVDSISKECPACKGEVINSNITPIYGNGRNSDPQVSELESGVKIPPRPRARRVEDGRQQGLFTGVSHIPVGDALRRIRIGLGLINENSHPPGAIGLIPTPAANLPLLNGSEGGIPTPAANPRLLNGSEGGEGGRFSGVVSERLVEDLETYISVANTSVDIQSEPQLAEMNLSRRNLGTTVLHMGALGNDGSVEIDLTISRRASSRRRGVLNLEGQSSVELRRR